MMAARRPARAPRVPVRERGARRPRRRLLPHRRAWSSSRGVVVGREMSRSKARRRRCRAGSRLAEADGQRGEDTVKTAARRAEEKVTFYRTLTAPTQDLPKVGKPTVEERMVPKDEPVPLPLPTRLPLPPRRRSREAPRPSVADRAGGAPRRPRAQDAEGAGAATCSPSPTARHAPGPRGAPQPVRPPAQVAAASATSEPEVWTVQVNAFRSRALAEELRARLAARGFDAYVFPSPHRGRPTALPRPGRSVSGAE